MASPRHIESAQAQDQMYQSMAKPADGSDITYLGQAKTEVSNLRKLVGNLGNKIFGGNAPANTRNEISAQKYNQTYLSGWRPLQPTQVSRRLKRQSGRLESAGYCAPRADGLTFEFEYGMTSFRGFYPRTPHKANQDYFIIEPNLCGGKNSDTKGWKAAVFGVFDGHGEQGDKCSRFVAKEIATSLRHAAAKRDPSASNLAKKKKLAATGDSFKTLDDNGVSACFVESLVGIDSKMHRQKNYGAFIDDEFSGTTAISFILRDSSIIVANVGDSRAISGKVQDGKVVALPLSMDQTPLRRDEYERVKAAGAEVLSVDQLDGIKDPSIQSWDEGTDDPPRCWLPGQEYPGAAFTRSVGDRIAGTIGVTAEPEVVCKSLSPDDRFILIASDGIFEFLSSQEVADIVHKYDKDEENGAQRACDELVKKSFKLWLQHDTRTDDITVILVRLTPSQTTETQGKAPKTNSKSRRDSVRMAGNAKGGSKDGGKSAFESYLTAEGSSKGKAKRTAKPKIKDKRQSMSSHMGSSLLSSDDREDKIALRVAEAAKNRKIKRRKPAAKELKCIAAAMADNFLFRSLPSAIAQNLLVQFSRADVPAGEMVIEYGGLADRFYVAFSGRLDVSIPDPSVDVEEGEKPVEKVIMTYDCKGDMDTVESFGELALMFGTPRTASVRAVTKCVLFAIERSVFREALRQGLGTVANMLHDLDLFKALTISQLDALVAAIPKLHVGNIKRVSSITGTVNVDLGDGRKLLATDMDAGLHRCKNTISYKNIAELRAGQEAAQQRFQRAAKTPPPFGTSNNRCKLDLKDLVFLGPAWPGDCGWQRLVWHKPIGRAFTLRSMSKGKLVQQNQHLQAMNEKRVLQALGSFGDTTSHISKLMGTKVDGAWLHLLMDVQGMLPLSDLWNHNASAPGLVLQHALGNLWAETKNSKQPVPSMPGLKGCHLGEAQALYYTASCVLVLGQLHGFHLMFRGISPQRLFVSPSGAIQCCGFKFSKHMPGRAYTLCGETEYMSPEQIEGSGHGLSSDWWALGVMAYEMITGCTPFSEPGSTDLKVFNAISGYEGPDRLKWEIRGQKGSKSKCSPACKAFVGSLLQRKVKLRTDSVTAYKDPWFVNAGVLWKNVAEGDPCYTKSSATDPLGKVPLTGELQDMFDRWQQGSTLPTEKTYTSSEDWFADF